MKKRVIRGGLRLRASDAVSAGHPPRRRDTYRPSEHMLNITYEDDIKITKNIVVFMSNFRLKDVPRWCPASIKIIRRE
jgi:hypothetical protein